MKKKLTKVKNELYHFVNGKRLEGYCTGLNGDLDICEISDEDRKNGVNIKDLIGD